MSRDSLMLRGMEKQRGPAGRQLSDATMARVVNGLRASLTSLQLDARDALLHEQGNAGRIADLQHALEALQRGFVSLADTTAAELDVVHARVDALEHERDSHRVLGEALREPSAAAAELADVRCVVSGLQAAMQDVLGAADAAGRVASEAQRRVDEVEDNAAQADRALAAASADQRKALELAAENLHSITQKLRQMEAVQATRLAETEAALQAAVREHATATAQAQAATSLVEALREQVTALASGQAEHAQQVMHVVTLSSEGSTASLAAASRAETQASAAMDALNEQRHTVERLSAACESMAKLVGLPQDALSSD